MAAMRTSAWSSITKIVSILFFLFQAKANCFTFAWLSHHIA